MSLSFLIRKLLYSYMDSLLQGLGTDLILLDSNKDSSGWVPNQTAKLGFINVYKVNTKLKIIPKCLVLSLTMKFMFAGLQTKLRFPKYIIGVLHLSLPSCRSQKRSACDPISKKLPGSNLN